MAEIREVDLQRDRLRRPRFHLLSSVRAALDSEVAGYALVVWDRDGGTATYMRPSRLVYRRMLPAIVHDALQQHVVLDMVSDTDVAYPDDPEGA